MQICVTAQTTSQAGLSTYEIFNLILDLGTTRPRHCTTMHLRISLLALITTTLLSPILAQNSNQTDFEVKCLKFPSLIAGNQTLNGDAMSVLSQALTDNSFTPRLPSAGITLKPGYSSRIGVSEKGGYQVCVQNWWFFKTLTIPLDNIAATVDALKDTCCSDTDNPDVHRPPNVNDMGRPGKCQDAKGLVEDVNGNKAKVVAQNYGDACCGMWGC